MNFHEIRFPTALSFGSAGGPERRTDIVTLANGFEERNTPWRHSRRRYDAGVGLRSLDDIATLIEFFEARRGQLCGFRWKDWIDFRSCSVTVQPTAFDQIIARGDNEVRHFQLVKAYASGQQSYSRPIQKPVGGTVRVGVAEVALNEQDFDVDHATGLVTLSVPPTAGQLVTAGFEFDVPVRFDTDRIVASVETFQAGEIPSVPIVEVRLA